VGGCGAYAAVGAQAAPPSNCSVAGRMLLANDRKNLERTAKLLAGKLETLKRSLVAVTRRSARQSDARPRKRVFEINLELRRGLLVGTARPEPVEEHGDDNETADEGALPEGADAEQDQAVAEPTTAPKAVPTPPIRLAPPMTAAAMTDSSMPWPRLVVMVPSQPTSRMPAMPAHRLQNM
jgi:hypothetical protein